VTSNAIPVDTDIWKNSIRIDGNITEKVRRLTIDVKRLFIMFKELLLLK
jgi:hypothetical protein